jgi:multisubunit Na+/H+ antiporter MnhG subunit
MTSAPGRRIPPAGILLFLGYAFVILGAIGVSLPKVVDQAIGAAVSVWGVATMALLAYTIFTITMVLQRKEAARGLALGLAALTIPTALVLLLLAPVSAAAIVPAVLGVLLFLGLRRPSVKDWLSEP